MLSSSYSTKNPRRLYKCQKGPMALPNALYTLDGLEWQAQQSPRQSPTQPEGDLKKSLVWWKLMQLSDACWDFWTAKRSEQLDDHD